MSKKIIVQKISTILNKLLLTIGLGIICSTAGLFGQCVDNSNYWIESWKSCSTSPNPNPARGMSNWLLFEFEEEQAIGTTQIWNANKQGESGLGAKEVYIDVSIDGINWTQVGTDKFTWPQGNEALDYEGFEGPDLSSFGFIQKVLITVLNNHDDSGCVSIAEFKFNINPDECYGEVDECGVCDGPGILTWFQDSDGDGLGDPSASQENCQQPMGYVDNDDDPCDNGLFGWADMEILFFENGCTNCHGNNGESGLDLTSFEGISGGGNICGSEILTGNTLVGIISQDGYVGCSNYSFGRSMNDRVDDAMDAEEISMIQEWIDAGAPYDCACPPGSPDSDNDGVCDASDECPNFDDGLIGTPCDDGDSCTSNDIWINSCECKGSGYVDSDFDGICDINDFEPDNPCTADGIVGGPEPAGWIPNETNDCDQDGIANQDGDQDDFDECITDNGDSLDPACMCPGPGNSSYSGAKLIRHYGIYEPTIYYSEGIPDGNLGSAIGWMDYVDFEFPYLEINQEICFEVGFNSTEGGVKFEINELGSYKFYNPDTTLTEYELQLFCFPAFVAGEQSIRVTRLLTGAVKVDGSYAQHCPCTDGDPKKLSTDCQCPGYAIEGTGTIELTEGFNNPENAEGEPDGEFTGWINGATDSIEVSFTDLAINSEICVHLSFDRKEGKISLDLNGEYFEIPNQTGSEDRDRGQDICFITKSDGPQYLKLKESGSGSIWIDGFYTKTCTICDEDSDGDFVCDEDDLCPGFDDTEDEDGDGIPDGCDDCNGNMNDMLCDDNDPCTLNDRYDEECNCAGVFADTDQDGVCNFEDICPDFDDNLIGTPCDDGDECTLGETYDTDCGCSGGVFQDADGDGICDAEDECDTSLEGTACDDGDDCTTQDVYDADCICAGTIADADNDGVCDEDDTCPDFDNALIGTACDDGDECTLGETYDEDCGCSGGVFQDADEDGICDAEDECDSALAGTACDDGDDCTNQDVYDADCNCAGVMADQDNDGVCDEDDTCPDFDNALIGTECDDGDECTLGETYDEDCGCSGGVFQDADEDGICDAEDECDSALAGTACDDGDDCTTQDVYDADCNCAGTIADQDNDGVCDEDDTCPDFDNALIGTACDDGDECTLGRKD